MSSINQIINTYSYTYISQQQVDAVRSKVSGQRRPALVRVRPEHASVFNSDCDEASVTAGACLDVDVSAAGQSVPGPRGPVTGGPCCCCVEHSTND